jgi:CRP/FNR family transcriptional regulator, cyclic AMP receptor protein
MPDHSKDKLLPASKLAFLLDHPIFGALGPELINRLGPHAIPKRVPQGAIIFSKGDTGTNLFAVRTGTVRISSPSGQEKSAVLNLIHAGEVFGEIALLDGGERTADAFAVTDCDLIIIDRRSFLPLVRSQPDVALKLIELLCSRLRRTSEQVENVLFMDLPSRLARTLLRLANDDEAKDQHPPIVSITQLELSQIIGMSRESTNKQLREWEKCGWLRLRRRGIQLLAEDMLQVAGEVGPADLMSLRSKK